MGFESIERGQIGHKLLMYIMFSCADTVLKLAIYRIPVSRTRSYYNSIVPSTITMWKNGPQNTCTKNIKTVQAFKNSLKNIDSKNLNKQKSFNHSKRLENIWHCQNSASDDIFFELIG